MGSPRKVHLQRDITRTEKAAIAARKRADMNSWQGNGAPGATACAACLPGGPTPALLTHLGQQTEPAEWRSGAQEGAEDTYRALQMSNNQF